MPRYLLDTDVVSEIARHPHGQVAQRARRLDVCTSILVAAELRYGSAKKRSRRVAAQVEAVLDTLDVLPFETPADEVYAEVRAGLEKAGTPIGGNDMLIAAHALALGLTLVTGNEREFRRVDGLTIENWLR